MPHTLAQSKWYCYETVNYKVPLLYEAPRHIAGVQQLNCAPSYESLNYYEPASVVLMMLTVTLGRDSIQLYALRSHPIGLLQTAICSMLRGKRVYITRTSLMSSSEESLFHATTSEIKRQ